MRLLALASLVGLAVFGGALPRAAGQSAKFDDGRFEPSSTRLLSPPVVRVPTRPLSSSSGKPLSASSRPSSPAPARGSEPTVPKIIPRFGGPGITANGHFGMFYSFLDPLLAKRTFTWGESEIICGFHGMQLASLDDEQKHNKVSKLMAILKVDGVWTSGARSHFDFYWGSGEPVSYGFHGWSHTGPIGSGQPDNAGGNEHCLAILNNAFGDGLAWHDVGCEKRMAFVCEPTGFGS